MKLLSLLFQVLRKDMKDKFNRKVSLGDLVFDRWEAAKAYGFGEGTSMYDNVLVIGDVKVGRNVWIGPNVILDGSGGLEIGDYCSISAGVQIYSHNTVDWALSGGAEPATRMKTSIGSNVYLGPQTVVQMGSQIGDKVVIGAHSLVKGSIPSGSRAWGVPATVQKT